MQAVEDTIWAIQCQKQNWYVRKWIFTIRLSNALVI